MSINLAQHDDLEILPDVDQAIVKLLASRYGDGFVYLRDQEERALYEKAKGLGLISGEGYLTPVGRSLASSYQSS